MNLDEYRNQYKDPRPDIKQDHAIWLRLLSGAKVYPDLHARLHFARCMGAHIVETATMYRVLPGEMTAEEWEMVKTKVFQPVGELLTEYFRFCKNFTEVTDEKLIEEVSRMFDVEKKQLVFGEKPPCKN